MLKLTHIGFVYQTVAHIFYIGVSIIFIESGQISVWIIIIYISTYTKFVAAKGSLDFYIGDVLSVKKSVCKPFVAMVHFLWIPCHWA